MGEYGIVIPQGIGRLREHLPRLLEDGENNLTMRSRELFAELYEQLRWLDERIAVFERKIAHVFKTNESCQRLGQMAGVGPMIATALVAAVNDANEFSNGRQLAAWLGLVPRQHSSGGKPLLLGISKRGDRYLRTLLIHGARTMVYRYRNRTADKASPIARWVQQLIARRSVNCAIVALANKMARQAWVILNKGQCYEPTA